jgi:hypothetical protein
MNVHNIQSQILPLLHKYGVTKADLFGSRVRGDATAGSDVDLLVELPRESSLFDYIGLKQDLEDALGCSVDLVEYEAVKPRLKPYIFRDTRRILPV